MKVQLIVVQGKPEGKIIPLVGPKFKIGRGETCHLRPGSEQVSREHAEFSLTEDTVSVQDLGSRNGTLVNGKAITEPVILKDKDLVQVGPLTFSLAIQGAAATSAASKAAAPSSPAKTSPEDVSHDDIESWLVSDTKSPMPDRPSGIYPGDTITITAFKDATAKPPSRVEPEEESDEEYERQADGDVDEEAETQDQIEAMEGEGPDDMPEDFIDESNPFYVKKKTEPEGPAKPAYKDTSDAANDILRKLMERRRNSR
jgi:pSer/pThr/pTyr-binding forkhead associated (FHA) protein